MEYTWEREEIHTFWSEDLNERRHLENLGVDESSVKKEKFPLA
jgi:hypothetical protein